jgi:shikimate kinase
MKKNEIHVLIVGHTSSGKSTIGTTIATNLALEGFSIDQNYELDEKDIMKKIMALKERNTNIIITEVSANRNINGEDSWEEKIKKIGKLK